MSSSSLPVSMTAGVFVECLDASGLIVGQAVFTDWHGRPVPGVGDTISVVVTSPVSGESQKQRGLVQARHFEVQHDAHGQPSVWVRVEVLVGARAVKRRAFPASAAFSDN